MTTNMKELAGRLYPFGICFLGFGISTTASYTSPQSPSYDVADVQPVQNPVPAEIWEY